MRKYDIPYTMQVVTVPNTGCDSVSRLTYACARFRRAIQVTKALGAAAVMRAAAGGTMTVDISGGAGLVTSTRASLLLESRVLEQLHLAQLTATLGTSAYADTAVLNLWQLKASVPVATQMTLQAAVFSVIAAVRALGYMPVPNITDLDPSVYFISKNFVAICDAAEAAVVATGTMVSSSSNFIDSPSFVVLAVYVGLCGMGCIALRIASSKGTDLRLQPLRNMMLLPNTIIKRLDSAAAMSIAAAERVLEYQAGTGDADDAASEDDARFWRFVSLTRSSKDVQKITVEGSRERTILCGVQVAPLLFSAFVLAAMVVFSTWAGITSADAASNELTNSLLAQVATQQTAFYSLLGSTQGGLDGNATLESARTAHATGMARVSDAFFLAGSDGGFANTELQNAHFGDLCSALSLPPAELARCGGLARGVRHSGLVAVFRRVLRNSESLRIARSALPDTLPPANRARRVRALMDSDTVTDMRILMLSELQAGMKIDGSIRAALVQATADAEYRTNTVVVSVLMRVPYSTW
jgi:hypothetical protein